ncbi:aminotransferase class I/II-fold pyridoxal phosphate-dependent enzyme, partial [Limosilactobacillus sp.]
AAYTKGADWLHQLKNYLLGNREYLEKFISDQLPQLHVVPGTATYLVWIDVGEVTDDSAALAQQIREKTGLIINPGTYYHGNGNHFIRINIAYPLAQIKDGLNRLAKAIND